MCNLYSLDKGQDAIRKAFGVDRDETGNLPPMPAIFPDQMAPIVRLADGERELAMMRWGFPSPVSKGPQHPVTKGVEPKFTLKDERYYYKPDSTGPGVMVLASSSVSGAETVFPSVFVVKHPKARIVGLALGHDAESHNIANYQALLRNSVKWVARK